MKSITTGKVLVTLVALVTLFGAYIADWNHTHIFNPRWPPHAKFHNAQTMLFGAVLGLLSLWFLWVQKGDRWVVFRLSIIFASLYWITQAMSILFPGTALFDPEFSYPGQWPVQFILDGVMFLLLIMAYILESKHLDKVK
ncbi:hypothetical protein J2787_000164 [Chryseobacterium rhizosphaerae]|uniref:Acetyltransferase n=1 Tax=Chryseobacterium rhizosphaerae TaxID=395937 RepID=A0AAE4C1R1_9FLAO|nr:MULTISPECIES: DUF6640 family protein [Chryseobacterium]MBL3549032.1 hypothetical protein [Chryseobacterium sp. KMC2]MDR6524794.1 hypothetical protein [Chryseobacterium rhizosphaerae]